MAYAAADLQFAVTVHADGEACDATVAAAIASHDGTVSGAATADIKTSNDALVTYEKALGESRRWDAQNRADADDARRHAYDLAEYQCGTAVALASQTYSDSVALARHTRDNSIADALETRQQDDAAALSQAADNLISGGTGSSDPDTAAWNQYQATLALDEAQYENNDATAQHTLSYEENQAAYDDAINVDLANLTRDKAIALDQQTEQNTEADATDARLVGQAANDKQKTVDDFQAWQSANDSYAGIQDAFNQAAISQLQEFRNQSSQIGRQANDALAGVLYDMICATNVTAADIVAYNAGMQSITDGERAGIANANDQYIHNVLADSLDRAGRSGSNSGLTSVEEGLAQALSGDLASWWWQNDTLLGTDEKAVGAALATQDENDTAARDTADEAAANLAQGEIGTDAPDEQAYNDNQAVEQQGQDVSDAEAQQTFEETEADTYVSQLDTWVQSLPASSPLIASATEQYQQAQADDQWVHDETSAQVTDVQMEDGAQVGWAHSVDQQSETQTVDDAAAMAGAIVASDEADAQRATTDDEAWTTEVQKLADATTTYDQANAKATSTQAQSDAKALHVARDAWDAALAAQLGTWADVMTAATITGDVSTVQSQMAAANLAQYQAEGAASVVWANTCAGDEATYLQSLADAKGGTYPAPANGQGESGSDTGWVAGITDAEAGYVAAAATAGAVETQSDAEAAAGMDTAFANYEATFQIALASADNQQTIADGVAQDNLGHAEAEADAADQVGYAQASAACEDSIWSNYAQQLASLAGSAGDPATAALDNYYAGVAADQSQQVAADETDFVNEEQHVTQADVTASDGTDAAAANEANAAANATLIETTTLAPEQASATAQVATNAAQALGDNAAAQATYFTATADALAQFYKDKAAASHAYDYTAAAAGVTYVGTMAPDVANYEVQFLSGQTITEDVGADQAAATSAENSTLRAARENEVSGYGDAEITEAQTDEEAENTLAQSLGADEVWLAEQNPSVANTITSEVAAAEEQLYLTEDNANANESIAISQNNEQWTTTTGTDNETLQNELGSEESVVAGATAGAEADYAISVAQEQATAAGNYYQSLLTSGSGNTATVNAAAFDAAFANEYVNWLSALRPAFITDSMAIAEDDAANQSATTVAETNLQDQVAADQVQFETTDATEQAQQQSALVTATDQYQVSLTQEQGQEHIGMAEADQQQDGDLSQAAGTYMVSRAQADKQYVINAFNDASDTDSVYATALASAKAALVQAQADADLTWVTSGIAASDTAVNDDLTSWQTMIQTDAQQADTLAHEDNSNHQIQNDADAQAAAADIVALGQANQVQVNSDAAANGVFEIADASQTAASWNNIVAWASPSSGNPNGEPGLPWIQSQYQQAAALANWEPTAVANEQQYAQAVGADDLQYAQSNSQQYLQGVEQTDSAEMQAANTEADGGQTLTNTTASDQVTFQQNSTAAFDGFQMGQGQAVHDFRIATDQDAGDFSGDDSTNGFYQAMIEAVRASTASLQVQFNGLMDTAATAVTTQDANAALSQGDQQDDLVLSTNKQLDQIVAAYQEAESADNDQQARSNATALDNLTAANANGVASALASLASQSPSPWNDLAAAQASAQAALTDATAVAQLALSQAQADSAESAEQSQAAATQSNDDAQAQAMHDFDEALAQAAHDSAIAQVSTMGQQLPDAVIPPDDGPAPALTPDYRGGYEANDYYVRATAGAFLFAGVEFGIGWEVLAISAPGFGGDAISAGPTGAEDDLNFVPASAGGGPYGIYIPFTPRDLVRSSLLPETADYQNAMHFNIGQPELPTWWGLPIGSRVPPPPVPGNFADEMRLLAYVKPADRASESPSQTGRNWDPQTVQQILELLDPQFAAWWGSHIGYNGIGSEGLPTIGNIESSGKGVNFPGWFVFRVPWYMENGPSASVGSGPEGQRPLTVNVPDSWTSEEVAHYVIQQAQPGGAFAAEYARYRNC